MRMPGVMPPEIYRHLSWRRRTRFLRRRGGPLLTVMLVVMAVVLICRLPLVHERKVKATESMNPTRSTR